MSKFLAVTPKSTGSISRPSTAINQETILIVQDDFGGGTVITLNDGSSWEVEESYSDILKLLDVVGYYSP